MAKLGEICDVRDGTHDSPEYLEFGFPLVTSKNICDGRIDFSTTNYISEKDYLKICERSKVDVGDILMPMIGTIGNPVIVNCNIEFAIKNVSLIKFVSDSIYNRFALYLLESDCFQRYISEKNRGGTQKFLSLGDIRNFEFTLPSFSVQKQIASTLDKVTDLINKRKQQLAKLDELVKSRFIELFGDPISNPMNLPVTTLKQLSVLITNGNTPKGGSENYVDKGILFIRSQNVWRNRIDLDDVAYIDDTTHHNMSKSSVHYKDILITKTGRINTENSSLGRAALYLGEDNSANINGHVYLVRLNASVIPEYVITILTSEAYRNYIRKVCVGGIDKRQINLDQVEEFPIILPSIELQTQFAAFVEATDKLKFEAKQGLEKLETLKKSLMQEYFG